MLRNTINRFHLSSQKGINDVGSPSVARQPCFRGYYWAQWCHTRQKLEIPSWFIGITTSLCSIGPARSNLGRKVFVYPVSLHTQRLTFHWCLETVLYAAKYTIQHAFLSMLKFQKLWKFRFKEQLHCIVVGKVRHFPAVVHSAAQQLRSGDVTGGKVFSGDDWPAVGAACPGSSICTAVPMSSFCCHQRVLDGTCGLLMI